MSTQDIILRQRVLDLAQEFYKDFPQEHLEYKRTTVRQACILMLQGSISPKLAEERIWQLVAN